MKKILRLMLAAAILVAVTIIAYAVLKHLGLLNIALLRGYVNKGAWGFILCTLLQVFQVIFIPLNTSMFTIPAIILFGPVKGFLICWIGCSMGSILLFIIVKFMGGRALRWIVGEEDSNKFRSLISKGKYTLPILLLIPIFPDDILCASAGLSDMKLSYFAVIIIITRGIDAASTAFIGSALVKSTLGIITLCAYILCMLILSYYIAKNNEKLEGFVNRLIAKCKKR